MGRLSLQGGERPYAIGVDIDQPDEAGFAWTPTTAGQEALEHAEETYGLPYAGVMAARVGTRWYISDGINSVDGEPYTPEQIELIRGAVDELLIAE